MEKPGETPKKDYFKVKFDWWEALIRFRIPGEQRQVLDYIIRKTYGWKKKNDGISLSQFVEATGLKKQNVHRALKALKEKNLIEVIKNDDYSYIRYGFNKYYKTWKRVIKSDDGNQKRLRGSSKVITDESSKVMNTIDTRTIDTITKDKKKVTTPDRSFDTKSIPYLLSETLLKQISINQPDFKPAQNGIREKTLQRWSGDIDKMIRLDKRNPCAIWNMIIWCQHDDFWPPNIQSGSKLRKKYDQLAGQINREYRKKHTQHDKLLEVGQKWLEKQRQKRNGL